MVKPRATGIRGHIERKKGRKMRAGKRWGVSEERRTLDDTVVHLKQM
jgi:hypothetical protein